MGWRKAMMLAVILVMGLGCPEEWRKGGAMDRAVAKDIKEGLEQPCEGGSPRVWQCDESGENCGWECPP